MDEAVNQADRFAVLSGSDEEILQAILSILSKRTSASAYGESGAVFASQIQSLPIGLRAMAATHFLDISLTLDSLCWHFRNFAAPELVPLTEEGLRELGLQELAVLFRDAHELMEPVQEEITETDEFLNTLDKHGLLERADELNSKAWRMHSKEPKKLDSEIYKAWIRYAREHPENVFD